MAEIVSQVPQVLEVHDIAGEDCYLVKLRTNNTEALYTLPQNRILRWNRHRSLQLAEAASSGPKRMGG
ncbi:MAG: Lrp/AsnC ligand binding domain-containing protein [bacterium]